MFTKTLTIVATAAAALLAAGCSAPMMMSAPAAPAMMSSGALVAPSGMTLYTFDKDPADGSKSNCNGPCAALWPPYLATATDKPSGAYTIVSRDDGTKQWAYKGKPVYNYKSDAKAGDRMGDNFKDNWHIIAQ